MFCIYAVGPYLQLQTAVWVCGIQISNPNPQRLKEFGFRGGGGNAVRGGVGVGLRLLRRLERDA